MCCCLCCRFTCCRFIVVSVTCDDIILNAVFKCNPSAVRAAVLTCPCVSSRLPWFCSFTTINRWLPCVFQATFVKARAAFYRSDVGARDCLKPDVGVRDCLEPDVSVRDCLKLFYILCLTANELCQSNVLMNDVCVGWAVRCCQGLTWCLYSSTSQMR